MARIFPAILSGSVALWLALAPSAHADTFLWSGGAGNGNWSEPNNWGGTTPPSDATADLQFAGTTQLATVVDVNDPWRIKSIVVNSDAGLFSITGNAITLSQGISNGGTGLLTINSNVNYSPTANGSTVWNAISGTNVAGDIKLSGALTLTTNFSFSVTARGGRNVTLDGLISNTAGTLSIGRTDSGTLFLTNANNSFSGDVRASTGTLNATSIANSGVNSAIGAGTTITLGQNYTGSVGIGRFVFSGASGGSSNRAILLNNGSTGGGLILENSVAGQLLTLSGNVTASDATTGTMALQGVGNGAMTGSIQPAAATLTKNGTGTWTLSGSNLYGGGTTVSQGTLLVNNVLGSGTGSGGVSVAASGTLGGTGRIATTAGAGMAVSGALNLATDGATDDLVVDLGGSGTASFASGAKFKFDLGLTGLSDILTYQNLATSSITFASNVVDFTDLGGLAAGNSYTLFTFDAANKYSGALVVGTGLGALSGSFTYNSNSIVLNVVPEPGSAALLAAGACLMGLRRRRRSR